MTLADVQKRLARLEARLQKAEQPRGIRFVLKRPKKLRPISIGDRPSERQMQAVRFIREYTDTNHFCPSIDDVRRGLCLESKNAVADLLRALRTKGWVDWVDGKSRTLHVLGNPEEA